MSNEGNLISEEYTNNVLQMASKYSESVCTIVQNDIVSDKFLSFTQGISIVNKKDEHDQKYKSPYNAIYNGTDVIIVGRE